VIKKPAFAGFLHFCIFAFLHFCIFGCEGAARLFARYVRQRTDGVRKN
jgi:hypothetical protein